MRRRSRTVIMANPGSGPGQAPGAGEIRAALDSGSRRSGEPTRPLQHMLKELF